MRATVFLVFVLGIAARMLGGLQWVSMTAASLLAGVAAATVMVPMKHAVLVAVLAGGAAHLSALLLLERFISPRDLRFVANMLRRRLRSR